jgi:hypothetical protein
VAFSLAVLCSQISLDKIPGYFGSNCPSTHAQNVHMIVLDSLSGREVIVNQRGPHPFHLIGADRSTYPATADRDAPLHFACDHCLRKRHNEIRIVVARS